MRSCLVSVCSAIRWPFWKVLLKEFVLCSMNHTKALSLDLKNLFLDLELASGIFLDTPSVRWHNSHVLSLPVEYRTEDHQS